MNTSVSIELKDAAFARGGDDNPAMLPREVAQAIAGGRHDDPFSVLGPHQTAQGRVVRAFLADAHRVEAIACDGRALGRLMPIGAPGLFGGLVEGDQPYRLRVEWPDAVSVVEDSYSFWPLLSDDDLRLIAAGEHPALASVLGAHCLTIGGTPGVRFAVWAPNARRVSVVGDFNCWDPRRHPMRLRHSAGVWEIFAPRIGAGERYKFSLLGPDGAELPDKSDPMARATEKPPATASVVCAPLTHAWNDADWIASRAARQATDAPMSIYEVHLASWLRPHERTLDWSAAAAKLIPYVSALGFTHIELLPISEHPFGGSWGYQPLALFAPTARHGEANSFARFVDACHAAGIGVILDWAPGHFPDDAHGLARFDGTALYEHQDPREGFHPDWNTVIYNFGRREVRNFLVASALRWLEDFHVDGLRVDAVASMLYRDYSRAEDQWVPNAHGGRENLEAVDFLRRVNAAIAARCPGAITIAEESTAWPGVTAPVAEGGLGFTYKWNMGWMNDTLRYMARDPIHRKWHHDEITFSLMYAFAEKFVLPLSHDEVVHGKRSLLEKMPGDDWRKHASLRALYGLMWTHPGKKLVFMGGEFGQRAEWNHDTQLDWALLQSDPHEGMLALMRDLNQLYRSEGAMHQRDARGDGFRWIVVDDRDNSVFAFARFGEGAARPLLVVVNMTPTPRTNYCLGAPLAGFWHEILNTDSAVYGGANMCNLGGAETRDVHAHGLPQSLELTLPPLAAIVLRHDHPIDIHDD